MNVPQLQRKTTSIFEKYNVNQAALFGSQANGAAGDGSDVDILVDMPRGTTLLTLSGMKMDLEKSLDNKVDIVTYKGINPLLRDRILSQKRIFYEKR
jgi:hypothetical protein